jgi:hypothetical protein
MDVNKSCVLIDAYGDIRNQPSTTTVAAAWAYFCLSAACDHISSNITESASMVCLLLVSLKILQPDLPFAQEQVSHVPIETCLVAVNSTLILEFIPPNVLTPVVALR